MIVFGVCTLGVAGLYLVPSVAGSPSPVAMPRTAEEPRPKPSGRTTGNAPQAGATGIGVPVDTKLPSAVPTRLAPAGDPEPADKPRVATRSAERPRTAFDPADAPDSEPPAAVTTIAPAKVTPDELSLSWPAATDNRRVIGYRIWLNGYEVATTAETRATLRWFNDDGGQHVVQIKAIDAAGNQSNRWSTLLITRPVPEPTETPRPTIAPTPTTPPPTTPTTAPTESATAEAQSRPTDPPARKKARPQPTPTGQ
jgi:hypothetical protein